MLPNSVLRQKYERITRPAGAIISTTNILALTYQVTYQVRSHLAPFQYAGPEPKYDLEDWRTSVVHKEPHLH